MYRNQKLYRNARLLRSQGKSYSEIHDELQVSKSTLCLWFSKKKWSAEIRERLNNSYRKINTSRLIQMNKAKSLIKSERHKMYRADAIQEYSTLRSNPLFISGLSIYWGEGEKTDNGRVSVINTDEKMIQVISAFYRSILHIPDLQLRAALFIYNDIDLNEALNYWSRITKIPKSQFIKTQVIPSKSKLTKRKTPYGMCNIYFSSTEINIKIRQWIKLLAEDMRV